MMARPPRRWIHPPAGNEQMPHVRSPSECPAFRNGRDQPGQHTLCVKVVDVFGCDTSVTVEVTV